MGLADFSIRKPVTTVMIFFGVALFGFISLVKLPMELFPPIKYPQLTIFTNYSNAAPEEIETLLTRPIEEAVGTVSGVRAIRSLSKEGVSLVFAEFGWDQNMDFASLRVREKVDLVKARLPRDASEPLVVLFNPFEFPVMRLSITGNRSLADLRSIATDVIKEEIEKIDGVASASVEGGLEREIVVDVNQGKLYTYGVPILSVSDAITNANLNYPAGTIKESFYEYLIRTLGEFENINDIRELVVKTHGDEDRGPPSDGDGKERKISESQNTVLLKDVANVDDTFKRQTSFSRYNKKENISISVQKQAKTNTIQVVEKIRKEFKNIQKKLPKDLKLKIVYDQSLFIKDAINSVKDSAWQGGIIVFLVLLMFLRNIKAALIVTLSIPVSIIVVFTCMYFSGLSLNIMSLGGLALGVGMLVDGAVVVIENIFRHREMGDEAKVAATIGTNEVTAAVVASVLTTVAVFLPMIFVIGIAGQLFKELSFTVTFSLLASLWVALTIIPLLSCKLGELKGNKKGGKIDFEGGKVWGKIASTYVFWLEQFMKRKGIGLLFAFLIFAASLFLVNFLEKELMPKADQGEFVIKVDLPAGSRVEETNRIALMIDDAAQKYDDVESVSTVVGSTKGESAKDVISSIGSHQAQVIVILKEKRKKTTIDIVEGLQKEFIRNKYYPAKIEVLLQQGMLGGAFGGGAKPIIIEVKGESLDVMAELSKNLKDELRGVEGVFGIEDDMPEASPEVRMKIDKDKASLYNVSVTDLAKVSQIILKGYVPSKFKEKGKEVDIKVILREQDRDSFDKLQHIQVTSPSRGIVPIGTVVKFEKGLGPSEIRRVSQERTIIVSANVGKRKIADVLMDVDKIISGLKIESGYTVRVAGESEEMKKSFASLQFALILSIVMVYMIMAAEFESFTQPLIILISIPLSLIGVFGALFITGTSLNVISLMGVIILGGIVVDNGIVLIDYTNLLMSKGKNVVEAIMEAGHARLRPIMITALATALGLIPMAFARGRGAELQSPMAISVMGGLIVSTFLTLFVVPAVFVLEHQFRDKIKAYLEKRKSKK